MGWRLSEKDAKAPAQLRVLIISANLDNKKPTDEYVQALLDSKKGTYDVVVVGTQEEARMQSLGKALAAKMNISDSAHRRSTNFWTVTGGSTGKVETTIFSNHDLSNVNFSKFYWDGDRGYAAKNKGGIKLDGTVTIGEKSYQVSATNVHLDSYQAHRRSTEWLKLDKPPLVGTTSTEVVTREQLANFARHTHISFGDFNLRNAFSSIEVFSNEQEAREKKDDVVHGCTFHLIKNNDSYKFGFLKDGAYEIIDLDTNSNLVTKVKNITENPKTIHNSEVLKIAIKLVADNGGTNNATQFNQKTREFLQHSAFEQIPYDDASQSKNTYAGHTRDFEEGAYKKDSKRMTSASGEDDKKVNHTIGGQLDQVNVRSIRGVDLENAQKVTVVKVNDEKKNNRSDHRPIMAGLTIPPTPKKDSQEQFELIRDCVALLLRVMSPTIADHINKLSGKENIDSDYRLLQDVYTYFIRVYELQHEARTLNEKGCHKEAEVARELKDSLMTAGNEYFTQVFDAHNKLEQKPISSERFRHEISAAQSTAFDKSSALKGNITISRILAALGTFIVKLVTATLCRVKTQRQKTSPVRKVTKTVSSLFHHRHSEESLFYLPKQESGVRTAAGR